MKETSPIDCRLSNLLSTFEAPWGEKNAAQLRGFHTYHWRRNPGRYFPFHPSNFDCELHSELRLSWLLSQLFRPRCCKFLSAE